MNSKNRAVVITKERAKELLIVANQIKSGKIFSNEVHDNIKSVA
jgi:hypothetical protein